MANFVNITLDKTAPVLVGITIGSVERTNVQGHNVSFNVSGGSDVAQYKLWAPSGDFTNPAAQTEGAGTWNDFDVVGTANDVAVTIDNAADGTKTLYAKVRDDVGNESGQATDTIVFDSTGPSLSSITINNGDAKTGSTSVVLAFTLSPADPFLTDYLIWGDLSNGETTKGAAESGTGYTNFDVVGTPNNVNLDLTSGDGTKTLTAIVRDDLGNESVERSDTIFLDQTAPIVVVHSGPTPSKISLVSGFDSSVFTWYWEATGVEVGETGDYNIEVGTNASGRGFGTQVPTVGGSTNVQGVVTAAGTGTAESAAADTANHISTTIKGADLDAAGSEGTNRVNIYIEDQFGNVTPYGA